MTKSDQSQKPRWRRFGFANVVALIALFVALGGGAYAASKIGTSDIKNKAVTSAKLDKKAVKGSKLDKEAVKKNKIKDDAVSTDKLGSESVTTGKLASQAVTSSKLEHPTYWAVAGPSALIRSHGAVSVTRVAAGNYRVEFDTDISQCSYQVTGLDVNQNRIGHADDDVTNPNRVFVSTRNTGGARVDTEYNLAVLC